MAAILPAFLALSRSEEHIDFLFEFLRAAGRLAALGDQQWKVAARAGVGRRNPFQGWEKAEAVYPG